MLTPDLLVTLLLFMVGDANRRGYRHLLDAFWDECATYGLPLPTETPVSAAAFCQARAKLSSGQLRRLLQDAARHVEDSFRGRARWQGRRVFAVDGSKVNLQRSEELDATFGRPQGGHCPQATVSTLVNVASAVPYDVVVGPYGACERKLLLDHLAVLRPGDVLVLDRGYPSHEVLRILLDAGIDFLIRVPATQTFPAIEVFRQSGRDDCRVLLAPPTDASGSRMAAIALRAVRVRNPRGEELFVLTSLPRTDFGRSQIGALYRRRWKVEELYQLEKSAYFDQRQYHGRSARGVRQEILAQALYVVLAHFLLAASAEHAGAPHEELSAKGAILATAAYLTRLCLEDHESALHWLPRLLSRIARARQKPRPGRIFPRRSFKPGPRWGPTGRRGA